MTTPPPYPTPTAEAMAAHWPKNPAHRAKPPGRRGLVWKLYRNQNAGTGPWFVICYHCRRPLTKKQMTVEHVIPQARGFRTIGHKVQHLLNLRPSCGPCNVRRGEKPLPEETRIRRLILNETA